MPAIPSDTIPLGEAGMLLNGYEFITQRCRHHGSDCFRTRILLQPAVCMQGPAAATFFYGDARLVRKDAMPEPVRATLLGEGGVQGLDGQAHRKRKQMFLGLMTTERVATIMQSFKQVCLEAAAVWREQEQVELLRGMQECCCRVACDWSGVPLSESELAQRTTDLALMIAGGGSAGPTHLRGRAARKRCERWIGEIVESVREGRIEPAAGTPLGRMATLPDSAGDPLPVHDVAVEILNVIRPTVAVARYIVFAAHALHEHTAWRERCSGAPDHVLDAFIDEVRRFYPFFPAVVARASTDCDWQGYTIPADSLVVLDLYGTCHHPASFADPDRFDPERFLDGPEGGPGFVPQGGGEHAQTHRCPGEFITIALMRVAIRFLVDGLRYHVPDQDLHIPLDQVPTAPRSGFRIQVQEIGDFTIAVDSPPASDRFA